MRNIHLNDGLLTLIHTDVIMVVYETKDKTYMTIVADTMLYNYITEDNVCIQDKNLKIINKHLLIPMIEVMNNNVTKLLMMQIESLKQEILLLGRCMHETVKVHAIKTCPAIPLNSCKLYIQSSEINEIIVDDTVTNIFINSNMRFNPPMTHVLSDTMIFDSNCDLDFDWKYLPNKLVSITVNNKQMLESFIANMKNMIMIPNEIHVNNYILTTNNLNMIIDIKSNIVIYNNDKLIKYEKIIFDFEEN